MMTYIVAQDAVIAELKTEIAKIIAELEVMKAAEKVKDWTIPNWPPYRPNFPDTSPPWKLPELIEPWPKTPYYGDHNDYKYLCGGGLGLSGPPTHYLNTHVPTVSR